MSLCESDKYTFNNMLHQNFSQNCCSKFLIALYFRGCIILCLSFSFYFFFIFLFSFLCDSSQLQLNNLGIKIICKFRGGCLSLMNSPKNLCDSFKSYKPSFIHSFQDIHSLQSLIRTLIQTYIKRTLKVDMSRTRNNVRVC